MADALERRLTLLEAEQKSQGDRLSVIEKDLKDIVVKLSARPTWLITSFITILTTVTTSLIVYVVTLH